jgi:hypothetical protein
MDLIRIRQGMASRSRRRTDQIGSPSHEQRLALFSTGLAMLSWHLVEKQALRLKDWTPRALREQPDAAAPPRGGGPTAAVPDGSTATPPSRFGAAEIGREPAAAPVAG